MTELLDAREFAEWMAYYKLEPWGPLRDDLRAGEICTTIAAVHGNGKLGPGDFFSTLKARPAAALPVEVQRSAARATVGICERLNRLRRDGNNS